MEYLAEIVSKKQRIEVLLPCIKNSIHYLIDTRNKDTDFIQLQLDFLLLYGSYGYGENEFKLLNGYYRTISPQASEFYEREHEKIKASHSLELHLTDFLEESRT